MNPAPTTATLSGLRRVTLPVSGLDPLAWLARQSPHASRVYWAARDRSLEVAGFGAARVIAEPLAGGLPSALEAVRELLDRGDPALRVYGGMRFDAARPGDDSWAGFAGYWFALPQIELIRDAEGTRLVANVPADTSIAAARAELRHYARDGSREARAPLLSPPDQRRDAPDRAGWERSLQAALLAMDAGEIEKIVLARRTTLTFAQAVDPLAVLLRLREATPDCFHFCFQPVNGAAFIGASPERLYKRRGDAIETEAVAGTRPRGEDAALDRELGDALLANDKERREHRFVRDMIRQVLEPLCTELRIDQAPSLFRLARGQHLFSGVSGTLHAGVDDAALLAALHPTPAVGGSPTPAALARIRAWEPFDRGWYAGPVGWIGGDQAEFAVAIRSALCRANALALYSGAGIVPGSSPAGEWDEIEHKIQAFIGVLEHGATAQVAP